MKTLTEVIAEHPVTYNNAPVDRPWICHGCMETGVVAPSFVAWFFPDDDKRVQEPALPALVLWTPGDTP